MILPSVAIIGRPNVGKSTLVNRLCQSNNAIVFDQPGVTRDRTYQNACWGGIEFQVVDTGGLVFEDDSEFLPEIRTQVFLALEEAAIALFVVDGNQGVTDGDLAIAKNGLTPKSNSIRGVFQGGATPDYTSEMSSIDIQSLGNATNFGSHLEGAIRNAGCVQNGTRGLWGGGQGPTSNYFTIVSYEFATTGSGTKFGELLENPSNMAPVSSGIRGVLAGGATPDSAPLAINTIQYITISTEGNATDFGDLTAARRNISGNTNRIRGTIAGGTTASSGSGNNVNTIDFITIASTGNAQDFGDLTVVRRSADSGGSDTHGGLVR